MGHVANVSFIKAHRNKFLVLAGALALSLAFVACDKGTDPVDTDPCTDSAVPCLRMSTLVDTGEAIFQGNCTGCHESEGHGYAGSTPPLANSDFFMNNRHLTIRIVLGGYESVPIKVNGLHYEGNMPTWSSSLTNLEIAGVLTYLRSVKNDSTVVSCDTIPLDELNGFAACVKTPRSLAARQADFISVAEVAAVRDSLIAAEIISP